MSQINRNVVDSRHARQRFFAYICLITSAIHADKANQWPLDFKNTRTRLRRDSTSDLVYVCLQLPSVTPICSDKCEQDWKTQCSGALGIHKKKYVCFNKIQHVGVRSGSVWDASFLWASQLRVQSSFEM